MLVTTKQTRPKRCYCRIQDDEGDLNEIAKIITVLNYKIVRLRNEVIALKNGDPAEEKLFENSDNDRKDLCSRCCKKEFCISRSRVNLSKSVISEETKALSNFFGNDLKKTDKEIPKDVSDVINLTLNEKAQKNSKPILEKILKKKKISRGVQCSSEMERKRKHFFNCFKKESNVKEEYVWERNKKPWFSSTNNICEDFKHDAKEPNYVNAKMRRGEQFCQLCETFAHDEKSREMKMFKNELAVCKLDQQKNERRPLKRSINRMVGGAEIRGNRLISDFGDKIQKIHLYKNAKFNPTNVKKRLDACIIELNEIIDDVSLLLLKTDTYKEQRK